MTSTTSIANVQETGYIRRVYPDDTGRDLATVLSYLTGRTLTKEEIWTAMNMSRSTYYDQLEKGTLITADNLRAAAANLGINRADLLTRYRLIDPEEITSVAEVIGDLRPVSGPPAVRAMTTIPAKPATVSQLPLRDEAPSV
ncbi:MAG TPA: hypothetical protein VH496_05940 [Mycobacterium sp.]